MSAQVTVTLPDTVYSSVAEWARRCGKTVEDVLAESIELSLFPLQHSVPDPELWTDQEVVAAMATELPSDDDSRLSELLSRQQSDTLADGETCELNRLMQQYQQTLLLKAQALHEAVRRGLQEPLTP